MSETRLDFITSDSKNFLTSDGLQYRVKGQADPDHTVTITLYQCSAEANRVDKSNYLTSVGTLTGVFRAECSITNPTILYEKEALGTPVMPRFNYVYINQFQRYYFVTDLTSVSTTLWRMDLKEDPLYTYETGIGNLSAFVTRNENTYNNLLHDNLQSFTDKTQQIYVTPAVSPTYEFNVNYIKSGSDSYHRWILTHLGSFTAGSTSPLKMRHYCNTNVKHIMSYQSVNVLTAKLLDTDFWTSMKNNNIWANDPTEAISSLRVYPFDLDVWAAGYIGSLEQFKIGSWTIPTNAEGYYFDPSFKEHYTSFRLFDLINYGQNFADYDDKVFLYLPFAGYVELNPADIYRAQLQVDLTVDYDTGEGTYDIYRVDSTNRYITSKKGVFGIEIPISSTQATERLRNTTLSGISAGIIAAGLTTGAVGAGAALTAEMAQTGVMIQGAQHLNNALGNIAPQLTTTGSTDTTALGSVYEPLECYIKICRKERVTRDYAALRGYPLNQVKTLSTLTGYTEVGEVHVEGSNFKAATLPELNEVEAQLKAGVIL